MNAPVRLYHRTHSHRTLWYALLLTAAALWITPAAMQAQGCTETETWIPIDVPTAVPHSALVALPDGLYAALSIPDAPPGFRVNAGLVRWDGASWSVMTPMRSLYSSIDGIAKYKGDLYIPGFVTRDSTDPSREYVTVARWDGTDWRPLPRPGIASERSSLFRVIMADESGLYCSYRSSAADSGFTAIMRWNGSAWSTLHRVAMFLRAPEDFSLTFNKGKLYALGPAAGRSVQDSSLSQLSVLEGDHFRVLLDSIRGYSYLPCWLGDDLFFFLYQPFGAPSSLVKWDGASLQPLPAGSTVTSPITMTAYKGDLYLFGANNSSVNVVSRFDGAAWHRAASLGRVQRCAEYGGELYVGSLYPGADMVLRGCIPYPSPIARLCTQGMCPTIAGRVYDDVDHNCMPGSGEEGLVGRAVQIDPVGYVARTDAAGVYSIMVPRGSYKVKLGQRRYGRQDCPDANGLTVNVSNGAPVTGKDFAVTVTRGVRDAVVAVTCGRARPGVKLPVTVSVANVGTATHNAGTLRLRSLPALPVSNPPFLPIQNVPGLLEWGRPALPPDSAYDYQMELSVPTTASIGDVIRLVADYDVEGDNDPSDNHDTISVRVTTAFDPNEIVVAPQGSMPGGTIQRSDSVLTYTIHFQNTGNDTAFAVAVADTLDAALDPATVTLRGSSHPCTFRQEGRGALRWTFANIMLPNAMESAAKSCGYLTYEVRLKRSLPPGTVIANRAAILFDFNAPVITNTAVNTIAQPSDVELEGAADLSLVPNPARDRATVRFGAGGGTVELRTLLGMQVRRMRTTDATAILDLTDLPTGLYLASITTGAGRHREEQLMIVR